jgi:hypothetical protein
VSAQAVEGRTGELADLGQDAELTEADGGCGPHSSHCLKRRVGSDVSVAV